VVAIDETYKTTSDVELPESALIRTEEESVLLEVLRDLPEDRQQLLILKFVENLSNAEIGRIMDRTEGAIKSLYHRTLLSLRNDIQVTEYGNILINGKSISVKKK
jgi:RNA polymerase sigma-70 factor (ECF subfamily)